MDNSPQNNSSTGGTSQGGGRAGSDSKIDMSAIKDAASNAADAVSDLYNSGKKRVKAASDKAKAQPKPHRRTASSSSSRRSSTSRSSTRSSSQQGARRSSSSTGSSSTSSAGSAQGSASASSRQRTAQGAQRSASASTTSSRVSKQPAQTATHRSARSSSSSRPAKSAPQRQQGASYGGASADRSQSGRAAGSASSHATSASASRRSNASSPYKQSGQKKTSSFGELIARVPRPAVIVVAVVLVGLLVWGCWSIAKSVSNSSSKSSSSSGGNEYSVSAVVSFENPLSTAQSGWTLGEMPYLYQIDPIWANIEYAGGTIAQNGSGPTSLAMVYIYLTGNTDMTVVDFCDLSTNNGYASDGGTSQTYMTYAAGSLGLYAEELELNYSSISAALEAGEPVIMVVGQGDFTTSNEYIVLCSIDDDNMVEVRDPSSALNTSVRWNLGTLLSQAEVAWAYTY